MSFAGASVIDNGKLSGSTTSAIDAAGGAAASSGYHLLVVEGYSRRDGTPIGGFVRSRPFSVGGHRWTLEYYPTGYDSSSAGFISVLLALDERATFSQRVKAHAAFSFIDDDGRRVPARVRRRETLEFYGYDHGAAGVPKFMRRDILERSRHLKGDSFVIRCDVIVAVKGASAAAAAAPFVDATLSDMQSHLSHLLRTKEGADLVLDVGGVTFAAHRCVLAARSTVFRVELSGNMNRGATAANAIQLYGIKVNVISGLLTFIYTDSLPDMEEDEGEETEPGERVTNWLLQLLEAADRYDLQRLKMICEEVIVGRICASMVADIVAVAERRRCRCMKKDCLEFIRSHTCLLKILTADGLDQVTRTCPSVLRELLSKFASQ